MTSLWGARKKVALAIALILPGCGGDDDPTGNSGGFSISVNPTTLDIPQGGSGSILVTIVRTGSFTGTVSLMIADAPTGVTATMEPADVTASTNTAQIHFTAAASAAIGSSTVTITGRSGERDANAGLALTIVRPPNYTLFVTPGAMTLAAGTSGNATVNIERSGVDGGITLSLSSPPPGITASFAPQPATTNTSSISVAVAPIVGPGTYSLTIRGGGGVGVPERTVLMQLTVTAAPTGTHNLEFAYCDPLQAPTLFAYQDGTGAWQAVPSFTSNGVVRYMFNLTSNRGGVMMVERFDPGLEAFAARRQRGSLGGRQYMTRSQLMRARGAPAASAMVSLPAGETYAVDVMLATTAELIEDASHFCEQSLPRKTVRGTVTGVVPGQYAWVTLGGSSYIFDGAASQNPVVFTDVQNGLIDFVGARIAAPGQAPDRAIMFRNLNPGDGGVIPSTIDFNGPASFQPATATVTITGGLGHELEAYSGVHTATTNAGFFSDLAPSTNTTRPWAGLSALQMTPNDFHSVLVFASDPVDDGFRASLRYVGSVTNQTVSLGPTVTPATVTPIAGATSPRYRFQGTLPPEYNKGVGFGVSHEDGGNAFSAIVTAAYLAAVGSASSYDITMPDVAGVAGFPAAARLTAGQNVVVTDSFGWSGAGVFDVIPAVGREFKASVRITTLVVP